MLFMVIERFRNGDAGAVGERFKRCGRMMPPDLTYVASWVEPSGASCYQMMEAPSREALEPWISAWEDLVQFEVTEVVASAEFWRKREEGQGS